MKFKPVHGLGAVFTLAAMLAAAPAHAGKTLDAIKARGQVICGVHTGLAGFSAADSNGKWSGIDADICRAVARDDRVPIVDHFAGWDGEQRGGRVLQDWTTDGCLPSAEGHADLARRLTGVLRPLVASLPVN